MPLKVIKEKLFKWNEKKPLDKSNLYLIFLFVDYEAKKSPLLLIYSFVVIRVPSSYLWRERIALTG